MSCESVKARNHEVEDYPLPYIICTKDEFSRFDPNPELLFTKEERAEWDDYCLYRERQMNSKW